MNVRLLGAARIDAADAADWYDQRRADLGSRFLAALNDLTTDLSQQPRIYGRVPRAPARREIREERVPGFPFLVTYELTTTELVILSVTHFRSVRRPWRQRLGGPPTP